MKLFAVIGYPISHSMSPAMHNAVFKSLGLECHYTLFSVAPERLADAVKGMKALGFGGVNVTIPHKVAVIEHLDTLSEDAKIIGAVNTLKLSDSIEGFNTDGIGALNALKQNSADPMGKKVLILGSGGAARAISVTLALRGGIKELSIIGINEKEVKRLADDISKGTDVRPAAHILSDEAIKKELRDADILIHATPVGMHPHSEDTLIRAEQLKPDLTLMDIVYNPLETRLMKEARLAGVKKIIGGVDMFVNQGAEALRIWLGIDPPVKLMKETVVAELRKKGSV